MDLDLVRELLPKDGLIMQSISGREKCEIWLA